MPEYPRKDMVVGHAQQIKTEDLSEGLPHLLRRIEVRIIGKDTVGAGKYGFQICNAVIRTGNMPGNICKHIVKIVNAIAVSRFIGPVMSHDVA